MGVERDNYQARAGKVDAVSTAIAFHTNAAFTLNAKHANYTLSIEVHTAIDNVLLQVDAHTISQPRPFAVTPPSSCASPLHAAATFTINAKHANYTLYIEVYTAIYNILLQLNTLIYSLIMAPPLYVPTPLWSHLFMVPPLYDPPLYGPAPLWSHPFMVPPLFMVPPFMVPPLYGPAPLCSRPFMAHLFMVLPLYGPTPLWSRPFMAPPLYPSRLKTLP